MLCEDVYVEAATKIQGRSIGVWDEDNSSGSDKNKCSDLRII